MYVVTTPLERKKVNRNTRFFGANLPIALPPVFAGFDTRWGMGGRIRAFIYVRGLLKKISPNLSNLAYTGVASLGNPTVG